MSSFKKTVETLPAGVDGSSLWGGAAAVTSGCSSLASGTLKHHHWFQFSEHITCYYQDFLFKESQINDKWNIQCDRHGKVLQQTTGREIRNEQMIKIRRCVSDTFHWRWRRNCRLRGFLLRSPINFRNLKDQDRHYIKGRQLQSQNSQNSATYSTESSSED